MTHDFSCIFGIYSWFNSCDSCQISILLQHYFHVRKCPELIEDSCKTFSGIDPGTPTGSATPPLPTCLWPCFDFYRFAYFPWSFFGTCHLFGAKQKLDNFSPKSPFSRRCPLFHNKSSDSVVVSYHILCMYMYQVLLWHGMNRDSVGSRLGGSGDFECISRCTT